MLIIKRIVFGLFVVLAILAGIWAYINLKNNKKPKLNALSVLPDNCLVYLKTNHFFELTKKLNSQSLIIDKLKLLGNISKLSNTLQTFDSLFNANSALKETLEETALHFALYDQGWVAAFNIKRLGGQEKIIAEFNKLVNAITVQKDVYEFNLNTNYKFYYTIYNGVIITSNTISSVQLAVNATGLKLENNKQFVEFKSKLQENDLLSVYVNHSLYNTNNKDLQLNLSFICKNGFSSGNITIEPSYVTFNGYLKPDSTEITYAFHNQLPQSADFFDLLPSSTYFFKAYGFNTFQEFDKCVNKKTNISAGKFWKLINDSALFDLQSEFYKNGGNYLVNFETSFLDGKFALLKVVDTTLTLEHLKLMSDSLLKKDSICVYKLKTVDLQAPLKLFTNYMNVTTNYVSFVNSHLVFAATSEEIFELIKQDRLGLNLLNNESFMRYKLQNLNEEFNYMVYTSLSKRKELIKKIFNLTENVDHTAFENFKHFSYTLVSNNTKNLKFRCQLLNETQNLTKDQNVLWTLNLKTSVSNQVWSFINHITKENELVAQDDANELYLINAKGTILWSRKVNEKINSKIYTVDIFKNNKYQLLFNTDNYIHLIDRNGNYVQGYPVRLPAKASSAMSMFDYDTNKNYRLFIACNNKLIYNYSIYGTKQEGFTPVKTDANVTLPLQYVKVGLSDYLVAIDVDGKIYTFSRKGEARIGLKNMAIKNCSAFYVDATNNINSTYLAYLDNNLINKVSFADKKTIIPLDQKIDSASVKFYITNDVKAINIIVTKPNKILVYNLNGELLIEKTMGTNLSESNFYQDENHSLYLSSSKLTKQLFLFDQLKSTLKEVHANSQPLISNLFNDNKKYMLIVYDNQLNCVAL